MREKVQKFLTLTGFDVDAIASQMIDMMVGGLKKEFQEGFGEDLPEKPEMALRRVEASLKENRTIFDEAVISTVEQNFTEAEVDDLIVFYESPTGRRLAALLPKIRDTILTAQENWRDTSLKGVEVQLSDILGDASGAPQAASAR